MSGDAEDQNGFGAAGAADATETTPFLGTPHRPPHRPSHRPTLSVGSVTSLPSVHVPKIHKNSTIVGLLCVIILISTSASGFIDTPLVRIVEDLLCHDYYSDNGYLRPEDEIDEKLCKVNAIQTDVQDVMSTMSMLTSMVGFFSAFPWGLAADR